MSELWKNVSDGFAVCTQAASMSHSALRGSSLKHDVRQNMPGNKTAIDKYLNFINYDLSNNEDAFSRCKVINFF